MIRGFVLLAVSAAWPLAIASSNGSLLPASAVSQSAHIRNAPDLRSELSARGLRFGAPIFVQIFKDSRELELYVQGQDRFELFRTYEICKVSGTVGPKRRKGDHQAPEGFYSVGPELMNPNSQFHLSFNIGYPNAFDEAQDHTGSLIMVHGGCLSRGCFAMTNRHMEQIYTLAEAALLSGQEAFPVHVFPFRMTPDNMHLHRFSRWVPFWENLKQGYDYFTEHGHPPRVSSDNGRYRFD